MGKQWTTTYKRALMADVYFHTNGVWCIQQGNLDDGQVYFQIYKYREHNGRPWPKGKVYDARASKLPRYGVDTVVWYWNDLIELPKYVREKFVQLRGSAWFELDYASYPGTPDYLVGNILTMDWKPNHVVAGTKGSM